MMLMKKKVFLLYYTYYDYFKNIVTVVTIESDPVVNCNFFP